MPALHGVHEHHERERGHAEKREHRSLAHETPREAAEKRRDDARSGEKHPDDPRRGADPAGVTAGRSHRRVISGPIR